MKIYTHHDEITGGRSMVLNLIFLNLYMYYHFDKKKFANYTTEL